MPTTEQARQAAIDKHPSNKDTIDYTNEYAWRAKKILEGPEARASILDPHLGTVEEESRANAELIALAQVQATLALAEETRTAALMAYLATLPPKDSQRPAVERDVQIRLGLITPTPVRTRPIATGDPVKLNQ